MNHVFKLTALAVLVASASTGVLADVATTKGGLEIKSEDGNYEAKLGGRLHLDFNEFLDKDDLGAPTAATPTDKINSSVYFRRAYLTLTGRAYDWTYKFENDFAAQKPASTTNGNSNQGTGFREVWVGHKLFGQNVRVGQAQPYRGMEQLTSSNEVTFMERPYASDTGIYAGREYQQGVFVDGAGEGYGYGTSIYNVRAAGDTATQALGYNARGFLVPIRSNGNVLHIGANFSDDHNGLDQGSTGGVQDFSLKPRLAGRDNGLRPTILGTANNILNQRTFSGEFAFRSGPFTAQAEYARAQFNLIAPGAAGSAAVAGTPVTGCGSPPCGTVGAKPAVAGTSYTDATDQKVETYYLQTSYFLTDHSKGYDFAKGVFKGPKITGNDGAIELKARYDFIKNLTTGAKGTQYVAGVNYYATQNTRIMVEYVDGQSNPVPTAAGFNKGVSQDVKLLQARVQFNF